jgi:hypothetical protein
MLTCQDVLARELTGTWAAAAAPTGSLLLRHWMVLLLLLTTVWVQQLSRS